MFKQKTITTFLLVTCSIFALGCNSIPGFNNAIVDPGKEHREKKQEIVSALETRRSEVMLQAAYARLESQNFAECRTLLTEVINSDPQNEQAYHLLAELSIAENRLEDALNCYLHCLSLTPNDADLHHKAGTVCELMGRTPQAQQHFAQASALEPHNPIYRMSMINPPHSQPARY